MNLTQSETSHPEPRGPEPIDAWEIERATWLAEQTAGLLYRENLIYLPFAAHLSEEDMSVESFAKAA